jgi:cytochrome P450
MSTHLRLPEFMTKYSFWVASSLATSLAVTKFAPHFSVWHSFILTAAAVFALQWAVATSYVVFIYPWYVSPLRTLPTAPGGSRFHGHWGTTVAEPSGIPQRRWASEIPNDGLIRYLHLWNKERVLVTSPKALAEVLTTKSYEFVKPALLAQGIGRILGIGLLLAEGDDHKMQRKNLSPAFHFRHIKELYPIFWAKSKEMVHAIQKDLDASPQQKPSVEIGEWGNRATLDIIGLAGMGQDFNAIQDPDNELNRVYRAVFQPDRAAQIIGLLGFFLPAWFLNNLPIDRNSKIQQASSVAKNTCRRLIDQKRQRLANKEPMQPDIISVALASGGFTDEMLVNNMMTFLAAGHETTASAFQWAVYQLCQKKDIQERLRKEIHEHISSLDNPEQPITADVIDNMPYLHAVCQETLRLWSPVPLTLRLAAHDTTLQGHFIPKDTVVILAPWAVNLSTDLWGPDAGEFNPDRWTAPGQANAGGAVSNYAMLTFLHGPRSCIGSKFAVAEFACLLAAFFGNFEVEMVDPGKVIDVKGGITARPKGGVEVYLKPVEGWN